MLKSHSCVSLLRVKTLNITHPCSSGLQTVTLLIREGRLHYEDKWE